MGRDSEEKCPDMTLDVQAAVNKRMEENRRVFCAHLWQSARLKGHWVDLCRKCKAVKPNPSGALQYRTQANLAELHGR